MDPDEQHSAKCPNNELGGHVYEFVQPHGSNGNIVSRCRYCYQGLPGSPSQGVAMKSLGVEVRAHPEMLI